MPSFGNRSFDLTQPPRGRFGRTMVAGLADVAGLTAVGDRFGVTANTIGRMLVELRVDIRLGVGGPARRRAAAIAV